MTGKPGSNRGWHTETMAVHAGEFVDPATRASSPNLVMSVTFAPDGRTLISTGWDRTVKVWEVSFR